MSRLYSAVFCLSLIVAYALPVRAQSTATAESVRAQVVEVSSVMVAVRDANDPSYESIGEELLSAARAFAALDQTSMTPKIQTTLHGALVKLADAYAVWIYARAHCECSMPSLSLVATQIATDGSLYQELKEKYGAEPGVMQLFFQLSGPTTSAAALMAPLAIVARGDARSIANDVSRSANPNNHGVSGIQFPLSVAAAKQAIALGSTTDRVTLAARDSEWMVAADHNYQRYDVTEALMETPFLKAAEEAATAKAKYEAAPTPAQVIGSAPIAKFFDAQILIASHSLHAFDDSVCVIKQGDKIIRPTVYLRDKNPSVRSDGEGYNFVLTCSFQMSKINITQPFQVTLANVLVENLQPDGAGSVQNGELHFNVDPKAMR
jgi:hypothetical protein